jgi:ABC-type uncharacterized transport system permease subunit
VGEAMSDTQFLTIVGTIWIAPYVNRWLAQFIGVVYLAISICVFLGWL